MTADNVATGLGAIIECVEMALFALLHVKAYTYTVYRDPTAPRLSRFRALVHALNFKETFVELWRGCVYMVHRARGRETDHTVRRGAAFESLFGKHRMDLERGDGKGAARKEGKGDRKATLGVGMEVEEVVHVGDERQWLGLGDEYAYGIGYHSRRLREKSDGLEEQIEKELTARGYRKRGTFCMCMSVRTCGALIVVFRITQGQRWPGRVRSHRTRPCSPYPSSHSSVVARRIRPHLSYKRGPRPRSRAGRTG